MAQSITFGSVTLWDTDDNGSTHQFSPGSINYDIIEVKAPLGTGFWLKPAGKSSATHTLELVWKDTGINNIKNNIENNAATNTSLNTLTVPTGSYPNCRLSGIGNWTRFKTSGSNYVIQTTLTFTQYP